MAKRATQSVRGNHSAPQNEPEHVDIIEEHHNQLRKCRGGLEKRRTIVRTMTSIRRGNDNELSITSSLKSLLIPGPDSDPRTFAVKFAVKNL